MGLSFEVFDVVLLPPLVVAICSEKKESKISKPKEQHNLSKISKTLKMTYNLITDWPLMEW